MSASPPATEFFDVVDEHDRVLTQLPRHEVHARKLLHRAVHIFVFNTRGELLIHLRSATKDEYPLCYTSSASGHLAAGEDYFTAAQRELLEELGLDSPLQYLTRLPASPETAYEHTLLYRTTTDRPPIPDPHEIAAVEFLPLPTIAERLAREPERFSPPFRQLFEWYRAQTDVSGRSGNG